MVAFRLPIPISPIAAMEEMEQQFNTLAPVPPTDMAAAGVAAAATASDLFRPSTVNGQAPTSVAAKPWTAVQSFLQRQAAAHPSFMHWCSTWQGQY